MHVQFSRWRNGVVKLPALLVIAPLLAASPDPALPAFDVASVKPSGSTNVRLGRVLRSRSRALLADQWWDSASSHPFPEATYEKPLSQSREWTPIRSGAGANIPNVHAVVPLSKDAVALAEEIHGVAQSEEGPSAIETRLALAEMVKSRDRQYALRLLDECVQGFAATKNSDAIAELAGRAMELYLELAPSEAEALARSLPGRSHPEGVNAREFAYDGLVDYWRKRETWRAEEVLGAAFGAGAFRVFSGQTLIRSLLDQKSKNRDPGRALGLFAQFIVAFHEDSADPRDILFLIESAAVVLNTNKLLANQAIEKALAAVQRRGFEEDSGVTMASTFQIGKDRISVEGVRKALLFQIAAYLKEQDPDVYHDNREAFQPVQDLLDKVSAANFRSVINSAENVIGEKGAEDVSKRVLETQKLFHQMVVGKPFEFALASVEEVSDPETRASLLSLLLGRSKAEQIGQTAASLLKASAQVKSPETRSKYLRALIDKCQTPETLDLADAAAGQLGHVAEDLCICQSKTESSGTACGIDNQYGGCPITFWKIAEYFKRRGIAPDDRTAASVQSRVLLLNLRELLKVQ